MKTLVQSQEDITNSTEKKSSNDKCCGISKKSGIYKIINKINHAENIKSIQDLLNQKIKEQFIKEHFKKYILLTKSTFKVFCHRFVP